MKSPRKLGAMYTGTWKTMGPWVENWYRQTGNPLYAWEAIARTLNSDEPIPAWAIDYLKEAAANILTLSHGWDFRQSELPRIEPEQAVKLVGPALGFWREAQKNVFAKRAEEAAAVRAASKDEYGDRSEARQIVRRDGLSIDDTSADRIIRRGKKLNAPSGKPIKSKTD